MNYQIKIFVISLCVLILAEETMQFFGKQQGRAMSGTSNKKAKKKSPFSKWFKKKPESNHASEPAVAEEPPPPPAEDPNRPPKEGPACDKKPDEVQAKLTELTAALQGKFDEGTDMSFYIKDDNYLLRWLIAGGLDIAQTEKLLLNHAQWRAKNKIDDLDFEDFGNLDEIYNVDYDGHDKEDRPVVEWWLSDWDIAAALSKPEVGSKQLLRWLLRILEYATKELYELNVQKRICITQAVMLVSLKDPDPKKQGCEQCMQLYGIFGQVFEMHYPNLFKNVHFADAGNAVAPNILKVMISQFKQRQRTAAGFRMYKTEEETKTALSAIIDDDQRSAKFGGTMNS